MAIVHSNGHRTSYGSHMGRVEIHPSLLRLIHLCWGRGASFCCQWACMWACVRACIWACVGVVVWPWVGCHPYVLPHTCCHTRAATHMLPHTCCHTRAATHMLPHTCCRTRAVLLEVGALLGGRPGVMVTAVMVTVTVIVAVVVRVIARSRPVAGRLGLTRAPVEPGPRWHLAL